MKHRMPRVVGFIVLALLAWSGAMAQGRPRTLPLAGTVLDPRGSPVVDATISLKSETGKVTSSVKTDAAGKFRFPSVAEGNYSVAVQAEGFEAAEVSLQVTAQPPAALSISLSLAQLVTEVSVNGEAPTQVTTDVADNRDTASVSDNLLEKLPIFDQTTWRQ
jgi:protocatechuate 3,4-dioxygenase beta subunit